MNKQLWKPLLFKEIDANEWQKRVIFFDPKDIPSLFTPRPYERHQNVSIIQLFPPIGNICGCGCGKEIIKPRRRWATNECERFAVAIRQIVYGDASSISYYLREYYGWKCCNCSCSDKGHNMGANGYVSWIKVDHIIPVKLGGGACWLSNYQLLCHDCHVGKTNKDFNWKQKLPSLFESSTK